MRLKSLEIKGFKSFADKTVLHFDEGITGIIGPNGCGKSNIIDSIRWVIGEHKISNLRSENLESLVFNGSKTRSASGLAEVSLTFENTRNLLPTEFSTVTITRRFYKNGDSEYRLNDVQCRLKDIHNLFMDTGVSTDSYAIIELGMVDDIIKDKENSRRRMLEQAAGITIYKTRKKEAKLKLDSTEQDLNRIEDLLFEINNQLKSLENQAKKAEKYFEIKKEYKIASVELAKASLEGFNDRYRELNEKQVLETDKRIELDALVSTGEAELEQLKLSFIEEEKELQQLQQTFNEIVQSVRTKENEKNLANQQLKFLIEKETTLNDFLQKSEGQLISLKDSVTITEDHLGIEKSSVADLKEQLELLKDKLEEKRRIYDEKRKDLDEGRSELQALQRQQFEIEKKVAVADSGIQNYRRSIAQLQEEQEARQQNIQKAGQDKEELEAQLGDKKADLANIQEKHDNAKAQIVTAQEDLDKLKNKLFEENRKFDQKRNEYDLLKSLIDNMDGYPESVKFLHNNPNWNFNAPILSDIIYVNEQYRAAVENVLEPYLNYYVVSDLNEGMKAVNLLEANQKGKANFFLLDQINTHVETENKNSDTNNGLFLPGVKPAMEVIEVDARYRHLAMHLLGNVFIAEDNTVVDTNTNHTILEKSGKFVKGKYSLTGGSVGLFEGKKIGRAKNLEKLLSAIQKQEKVIDDLKTAINKKQTDIVKLNEQLKEKEIKLTEQEILQLTNAVFAAQNKMENLQAQQNSAAGKLAGYEEALAQQQDAIADERELFDTISAKVKEALANIEEKNQNYKLTEQDYQQSAGAYNEGNINLTRQQSKVTALQQELTFKQQQVTNLEKQIEESTIQLGLAGEQIIANREQLKLAEQQLIDLMRQRESEEIHLNKIDQAY